jgi:hypothetical protein
MADPTPPPDPSAEPTRAGDGTFVWQAGAGTASRFPPGLLLAGRFRIIRFLGQGGTSTRPRTRVWSGASP